MTTSRPAEDRRLRVAILGSGLIGTDLLAKLRRSRHLNCVAVLGRNLASTGMQRARSLGLMVSDEGIGYIERHPDCCDLVFDATSAIEHPRHAQVLRRLGKTAIDLTPARVGVMCIPAVNMAQCLAVDNVNMVTCGGQAAIPIAHALGQTHDEIEYIEVVSAIAARSAGPATRRNLDEYLQTTAEAVQRFSGAARTKAILNINPAEPCVNMQTTLMARVSRPDIERFRVALDEIVKTIRAYVPGYDVLVGPTIENGRIFVMVRVRGLGDHLPPYAGNLDIINCAAIIAAESFAAHARRSS